MSPGRVRDVRLALVDARGLEPHAAALRRLEAEIDYPIADGADRFVIDHGEEYHRFFSALGDARFLVAIEPSGEACGVFGGVLRHATLKGERVASAYACDLKLARRWRATGLARRMLVRALGEALRRPQLRRWRIAYAAAMRGARGDVFRTVRGAHPGKLAGPLATLRVYFADPERLARLEGDGPRPPEAALGYDLSPEAACSEDGLVTTRGRKDMRLRSTGEPWPLVHVPGGPSTWGRGLGQHLRRAARGILGGRVIDEAGPPPRGACACFALDARLGDHVGWLAAAGVEPGAVCTVYALVLPGAPRRPEWVHLATSEI